MTYLFASDEGTKVIDKSNYNTTFPTGIIDFTEEYDYIDNYVRLESFESDNGILFVANDDDPCCCLPLPESDCADMCYMNIMYRAEKFSDKRNGEIYFSTESNPIDEFGKTTWKYDVTDGSWATSVVPMNKWYNLKETLTYLRFDPLAGNGGKPVEPGDSVEVSYVAFFSSKKEAQGFSIDEFRRYNDDVRALKKQQKKENSEKWNEPGYMEMNPLEFDTNAGTLKFTEGTDGKYTVSYNLNGRTVSYTVPDTAQFRNGPLAGTDDLGRKMLNQYSKVKPDYTSEKDGKVKYYDEKERVIGVYGENGEHYVGIFYFLIHSPGGWGTPKNIQKILETYGNDAKNPAHWYDVYNVFYFAKPFYGYYSSTDKWVIRKHMELLSNAGVDFLYFDTTNNQAFINVVKQITDICHEMNEDGWNAPKIVFYTNAGAKERVNAIYEGIYKKGEYKDTWLYVDGKPLIIAPKDANINDFFTTREPQWPNEDKKANAWPWIDWNWPQEVYGNDSDPNEAMNISVAQHSGSGEFSMSGLYGYTGNRGRSFDGTNDKITDDSYKLGLNFRNELNYAYVKGCKYYLFTGWNEWVTARQEPTTEERPLRFIDTFNYEYSRDIEMTEGGYFDNYYMQMAAGIAMLKGAVPTVLRDDRKMINVTGSFDQWDSVSHTYYDVKNDCQDRDFSAAISDVTYKDSSGRNDITKIKVTNDTTYIHFYVECSENILHGEEKTSWMQIFVNTGKGNPGWYGYDYIINYKTSDDCTTSVAAYSGKNGAYDYKETGKVTYHVSGKKMMISVPLEMLGIEYSNRINIEFKVADSRTLYKTMEQFYSEGDCAPLGRLNYVYQTYIPDVSNDDMIKVITLEERASGVTEPEIVKVKGKNSKKAIIVSSIAAAAGICAVAAALIINKKKKRK